MRAMSVICDFKSFKIMQASVGYKKIVVGHTL